MPTFFATLCFLSCGWVSSVGGCAVRVGFPDDIGRVAGIGRTRSRKDLMHNDVADVDHLPAVRPRAELSGEAPPNMKPSFGGQAGIVAMSRVL